MVSKRLDPPLCPVLSERVLAREVQRVPSYRGSDDRGRVSCFAARQRGGRVPVTVRKKNQRKHAKGCALRRAVETPVGIECEHGYDVCPKCDACTCRDNEGDEASP